MLVRDEAETLPQTLPALRDLVDAWTIIDTGSVDGTPAIAHELLAGVPGRLVERPWRSFAENRSELFQLAGGDAEWLLLWDGDWLPTVHPDLAWWFADDQPAGVDAWSIEVREPGLSWWMPQLLRAGAAPWRFEGEAHSFLAPPVQQRKLRGLTATHLRPEGRGGRLAHNLAALQVGYENGDPRSTVYYAVSLRNAGRTAEAIDVFRARAAMPDTWEEEGWWSAYQAARLAGDVDELLEAHRRRPWRFEPLAAAARLVAAREHDDVLFLEQPSGD